MKTATTKMTTTTKQRQQQHIPGRVINVFGTTIMWDVIVITDKKILAN
jgi:hypothetical protein